MKPEQKEMIEPADLYRLKVSYICDVCKLTTKDSSVMISHSGTHSSTTCNETLGISLEGDDKQFKTNEENEQDKGNGNCTSPVVGKTCVNGSDTPCNETVDERQQNMSRLDKNEDFKIGISKKSCEQVLLKPPALVKNNLRRKENEIHNYEFISHACEDCGKTYRCERLFNKHTCSRNSSELALSELQTKKRQEQKSNDEIEIDNEDMLGNEDEDELEYDTVLNSRTKSKFVCSVCKRRFKQKRKLLHHQRKFHSEASVPPGKECEFCNEVVFGGQSNYLRHIAKHTGKFQFSCDYCGKGFHDNYSKKMHSFVHKCAVDSESNSNMKEVSFQCDECDFVCVKFSQFTQHKRAQHRKSKNWKNVPVDKHGYSCDTCGKFLKGSYSHYMRHVRRHTGERPFVCDICGASFIEMNLLTQHKTGHTGAKPCLCDICGKSFLHNSALNRHKTVHKAVKDLTCDKCNYQTTSKDALRIHDRRVHLKDKKFPCKFCNLYFFTDNERRQHTVSRHTEKKEWKCFLCGVVFNFQRNMQGHLSKAHPEYKPLQCQFCDFKTKRPYLLKTHLGKHSVNTTDASTLQGSWRCSLKDCNFTSVSKDNFITHMQEEHNMNIHETIIDGNENEAVMNCSEVTIVQMGESTIDNNLLELDGQTLSVVTDEATSLQDVMIDAWNQVQVMQTDLQIDSVQHDTPITNMDSSIKHPVMFVAMAPNSTDDNIQMEEVCLYEVMKEDRSTAVDSHIGTINEDTVQSNIGAVVVIENK